MKNYIKLIKVLFKEISKEAFVVFLVLFSQMMILVIYYITTIFLLGDTPPGQLLSASEYFSAIVSVCFNLTLGFVVGGYGVGLFVYRMFIAPYIARSGFLVVGKVLTERQLFILRAFLLTSIISIMSSTHMVLYVFETGIGDLYINYHFTRHTITSALVASVLIYIVFFILIKRREKGSVSIVREYCMFAPIILLALSLSSILPSYDRAFADLVLLSNKRVFEYEPQLSWVARKTTLEDDEESVNKYKNTWRMNKEAAAEQVNLAHKMVTLSRNDTEAAEAYQWLAYLSGDNGSITSQRLFQQVAFFLDPTSPTVLHDKAMLELYRGRFDKAVERSVECIDSGEIYTDATACYETELLGYWFGGDEVRAQAVAYKMYDIYPDWPSSIIWNRLAPAFTEVYHLTMAEGLSMRREIEILCKEGRKEECSLAYARNYWGTWKFEQAINSYDSILKTYPNSIQAAQDKLQLAKEMRLLESLSPAKPCSNCSSFYDVALNQLHYQGRSND